MNFQWHLTNRCNLRCRHCYQTEYQDPPSLDRMKLASRLLNDLRMNNSRSVINLTGGEPLLLGEELYRLLAYLDLSSPVTELMIITNGVLLDQPSIDRFSQFPKLTTLKISLEGPSAQTNDPVRGAGVFQKACETLKRVRDTGRFQLLIMYTLTRANLKEVVSMLEFVQQEELDGLIIERFIPEGRGRSLEAGWLSHQEWVDLGHLLTDWCKVELPLSELSPYRAFWIKGGQERELLGAECHLGESFCIMPDGTIFPCRRFVYPLGNLFTESLWKIIDRSSLLREIRDKTRLKGRCRTCIHRDCYGCRALGYAVFRDHLAEDSLCFEE